MPSLGELIEFSRHQLSGLDQITDAVAALTAALTATATGVQVDDTASGASKGIAEIDLELVRIKSVNNQDASLTLYPFGRGYRGTVARTHEAGVEVRFNPAWPAGSIAREINGVLNEIYPSIYGVRTAETALLINNVVTVDDEAVGVISVWFQDRTATDQWIREDVWDYNRDGSTTASGLRIGGRHNQGDIIRVVYAARPRAFDLQGSLAQDFADTTGLDPRAADLLTLGVARRLAVFVDVAKLPFVVAAAADAVDSRLRSSGNGTDATKILHSLFQARLAQEASILVREHPIRVHRVTR